VKENNVPQRWVDAAIKGIAPGRRPDPRTYLANAYSVIREDILWEAVEKDVTVTCACGMEWFLIPSQGPDPGHGRDHCESAGEAVVRIKGVELTIHRWTLTPLADWANRTGRWQLSGWLRGKQAWGADLYNGARLESANLPGRECPTGQLVDVEVCGYGGEELFLKVAWDKESQQPK
jgi:hypothetical protein